MPISKAGGGAGGEEEELRCVFHERELANVCFLTKQGKKTQKIYSFPYILFFCAHINVCRFICSDTTNITQTKECKGCSGITHFLYSRSCLLLCKRRISNSYPLLQLHLPEEGDCCFCCSGPANCLLNPQLAHTIS